MCIFKRKVEGIEECFWSFEGLEKWLLCLEVSEICKVLLFIVRILVFFLSKIGSYRRIFSR